MRVSWNVCRVVISPPGIDGIVLRQARLCVLLFCMKCRKLVVGWFAPAFAYVPAACKYWLPHSGMERHCCRRVLLVVFHDWSAGLHDVTWL